MARRWVTRDYLQAIESVRAVGEDRVEVRTQFSYPMLLSKLFWGFVLPARALAASPVPALGTGPYRLAAWAPGRELVLERNPEYRGPAPEFARARFSVVPDAEARVRRLVTGEADLADQIPPEQLAGLEARRDVRVVVRPGLSVLFLVMRVDEWPFGDRRVREAIDVALDREELIRRALSGHGEPASQLVPRAVVGFNPRLAPTRHDPARARALLAAAGHARGLSLRLDGTDNRYVNDGAILAEVARQLGEVGIRVEVRAQDKAAVLPALLAGRSSFHMMGWACESGEAGDALDALLHSPDAGQLGSLNTSGLADPGLDRLIDESHRSRSRAVRTARLQEALAWVARQRPVVPLVVPTEAVAFSPRLRWDPPVNLALRVAEMGVQP
jgi:peptide/nickel transport system substrate-binding protein